jgi:hypothetical protein
MSNLSEIQYWSIDIQVIFNVEVSKQVENASLHELIWEVNIGGYIAPR